MAWSLHQPDVLQADLPHLVRGPLCAPPYVGLMLRQRADARDGQKVLQLVDVSIALHVDEIHNLVDAFHVDSPPVSTGCSDARSADPFDRPTLSTIRCSCEPADSLTVSVRDMCVPRGIRLD